MENQDFNPVQEWINNDEKLSKILVEIQELPVSIEEQAEIAFHRISEEYNLTKMPQDIDDDEDIDEPPTTVYEQLGLINYAYPNNDPRGNVLMAMYCTKENISIDFEPLLQRAKNEGIHLNNVSGIGFFGENFNVRIIFVHKNESWFDLGCNFYVRYSYFENNTKEKKD